MKRTERMLKFYIGDKKCRSELCGCKVLTCFEFTKACFLMLEMMKRICKIPGNGGSNTNIFSCDRVDKFQLEGVQGLSMDDPVIRIV